jgi:hypothetical protein
MEQDLGFSRAGGQLTARTVSEVDGCAPRRATEIFMIEFIDLASPNLHELATIHFDNKTGGVPKSKSLDL